MLTGWPSSTRCWPTTLPGGKHGPRPWRISARRQRRRRRPLPRVRRWPSMTRHWRLRAISVQAVDAKTLMAIHQARANLYFILSDFERSRAEGERFLALAQRVGDRMREGVALTGMGWASEFAHDFGQALAYVRQAIAVAKEADAKSVLAGAHLLAGHIYEATARLDHAREEIAQALTISQTGRRCRHQSLALWLTGHLKRWEGAYDQAVRLQAEGLRIAREHHLLEPLLTTSLVSGSR